MKPLFIFLILTTFALKINANPIALPTVEISEIYFDNSGEWFLELAYNYVNRNEFTFDSIFIYSATDSVKLPTYTLYGSAGIFVVTSDSLDSDFKINRYGDTIKVISYAYERMSFEDLLVFGNSEGAVINYPRPGQSICKYWWNYVKDNSPSIGFPNDTSGMCGTVTGIIFDKYSVPVNTIEFYMDNKFVTTENGEYSTRAYAKASSYNLLYYGHYHANTVSIDPIDFIMEPDSGITRDIYLLDTLSAGLDKDMNSNNPIKLYPNPISKSDKLHYEIDLPVKSSDIRLEFLTIDGKILKTETISEKTGVITMPDRVGLLLLNIFIDNKLMTTNRILSKE